MYKELQDLKEHMTLRIRRTDITHKNYEVVIIWLADKVI